MDVDDLDAQPTLPPATTTTATTTTTAMPATGKILTKILDQSDLDQLAPEVITKIEKYFDQRFEDFLTTKALHDNAQRNVDDLQTKYEVINSQKLEFEAQIAIARQNVDELRAQLDLARSDSAALHATVERLEADALQFRNARNAAFDERDQLLKVSERSAATIDRLNADCKTLQAQLEAAIAAKVEAVVRADELDCREHSIEQRERLMEQERGLLQTQIASLTENLHKSLKDNQAIRHENTLARMQLETDVQHKTEELKLSVAQCTQYAETNQELTTHAKELTVKLQDQANESTKMMEHYQKELQAKSNLVDLFKAGSDDNNAEKQELLAAIAELKKHLAAATAQYGELETRLRDIDVVQAEALAAKDERLEQLREELANANELLRSANEENIEHVLEQMTPTAAAASRRLKSGMTLTEIFTQYVKAVQDLQVKERECSQNEIQLKSIVAELEEKAPEWKRQAIEYQNVVASNEELQAQLEKLIGEQVMAREEAQEAGAKMTHVERENRKMKAAQADLARQVCYLLKEIEQMRGGFTTDADQSMGAELTANEMISKKLVTFGDIVELQDNNQKLLLLVRDLGAKLEELEEIQSSFNQSAYEARLAGMTRRVAELESSAESQARIVQNCTELKDRYKRLYYEIMRDVVKPSAGRGGGGGDCDDSDVVDEEMNGTHHSKQSNSSGGKQSAETGATIAARNQRIAELEASLADHQKQHQQLRDEYVEYRKEKLANDKLANEQIDQMRREVRELTANNCNLVSAVNFHTEQVKIQQKNMAVYKKQIQTLEERNRNYDKTIAKHEHTIAYLRDKTMTEQQRSSMAELQAEELQRQLRKLQDDVSRLTAERDALYRERHNQNILQNNLELIKTTFERSENDGRIRMEQRFDQTQRECSALRRRLQEEQDHFRELAADLKRQTETAVRKQTDEQAESERLRASVEQLRADLEAKVAHISELSGKLQESLTPCQSDNPIARANKQIKELQLQCDQQLAEVEHLRRDHASASGMVERLTKVAGEWELVSKELQEQFDVYKTTTTERVAALELSETNLKSRIEEQEAEIRLQITGAQINTNDTTSALHRAQLELKDALQKCGHNARELRELRNECQQLKTALQSVEQKYSNEMILHSADIQSLTQCKEELNRVREQIDALNVERNVAVESQQKHLQELRRTGSERDAERAEAESRIRDLNAQNSLLHDQLQQLNSKVSDTLNSSGAGALNDSLGGVEAALNRSMTEEEHRSLASADQLQTIIKYLRKEKDIAVSKVEMLRAENVRLSTEAQTLQKRVAEANELAAKRSAADATVVSSAKHSELLRKVETLNAITDSNRLLREERDTLAARSRELTERVTKIEDDLFPLQEKNRELQAKTEEQAAEMQSLRRTAEQWHKRATTLVERSNKNPEDFKRLQQERENLAKMLTAEKEALRLVQVELASLKADKLRLETESVTLRAHSAALGEERRKVAEELGAVKQATLRLQQELNELRGAAGRKDTEVQELTEQLATTEAQMTELRNKEQRVRSLAKKFKEAYLDSKGKYDALVSGGSVAGAAGVAAATGANESGSENSQPDPAKPVAGTAAATPASAGGAGASSDAARSAELLAQIEALREECETLRSANETLRSAGDQSQQLAEANVRIKLLTEAHAAVSRDLQTLKAIHDQCDQARSEQELLVAGLRSQTDGKIARLEKELAEMEAANKENSTRLQRDIDTLTLRCNQLHRQLQTQGSKPSTSSGPGSEKSPSDAARTANVKPMAGPSSGGQQSASVTPRRGGDTPLASIRPMSVQNSSRTAAVLPTSQNIVAAVQGSAAASSASTSSSSGGAGQASTSSAASPSSGAAAGSSAGAAVAVAAVAAAGSASGVTVSSNAIPLIPPQQQVHTTGQSQGQGSASAASTSTTAAEAMSSSPTSSHTDYQPASSSAVVAAVPPMGSSANSSSSTSSSTANTAESTQEAESMPNVSGGGGGVGGVGGGAGDSSSTVGSLAPQSSAGSGVVAGSSGQPQTVALVSPRVELALSSAAVQQSQQVAATSQQSQAVAVAGGSSAAQMQPQSPQAHQPHQTFDASQAAASTSGSGNALATNSSSSSTTTASSSAAATSMPTASTSSTSSTTSSTTPLAVSQHQQASSSSTVTTTQAQAHKRPRDPDAGESSSSAEQPGGSGLPSDANKTSPKSKRSRLAEQGFQGISESGIDVEYQVPTSSQRDQEDDNVIVVDSDDDDDDDDEEEEEDEEEDEMADEGIADGGVGGGQFDEQDGADQAYGMEEEPYDQDEQDDEVDEGGGAGVVDLDGDIGGMLMVVNNEVDVEDSSDVMEVVVGAGAGVPVPGVGAAAAAAAAGIPSDVGTSGGELAAGELVVVAGGGGVAQMVAAAGADERQQFQAISSGSSQQLQQQQQQQRPFEETDGIVPSTPTLFPRGGAASGALHPHLGEAEAVSSPQSQVPQSQSAARFTFGAASSGEQQQQQQSAGGSSGAGSGSVRTSTETENSVEFEEVLMVESGSSGGEQVPIDAQIVGGGDQVMPQLDLTSAAEVAAEAEAAEPAAASALRLDADEDDDEDVAMELAAAAQHGDQVAAAAAAAAAVASAAEVAAVPEAASLDNENVNNGASTSEDVSDEQFDEGKQNASLDDEIGTDGVTSEGEKVPSEEIQVEEGREAEATIQTPSSNTRSRTPLARLRATPRGGRGGRGTSAASERRTPILWDAGAGASGQSSPAAGGSGTQAARGAARGAGGRARGRRGRQQ